jgi:hypothetical protein
MFLAVASFFGTLTFVCVTTYLHRNAIITTVGNATAQRVDPVLHSVTKAADTVSTVAGNLPVKTLGQVKDIADKADRQLTSVQTTVTKLGDKLDPVIACSTKLLDTTATLVPPAKETLTTTNALVQDAKDSWDDIYYDVKAMVGSATVAARGVAETSEAVGKAAPSVAKSVAEVAAGVKREADEFTKPKTVRQKVFDWVGIIPRIVGGAVGSVAPLHPAPFRRIINSTRACLLLGARS